MNVVFPLEPEQQADHSFAQAMDWLRAGQLPAARGLLERAARLNAELGRSVPEGYARLALGRVYQEMGQTTMARAEMERAGELLRAGGDRVGQVRLLFELGELAEQSGLGDEARQRYEKILSLEGDGADAALAHLRLGALFRDRGDIPDAREHYAQAVALFEATGNELGEARARLEEAALWVEAEPARAEDLYRRGLVLAELYGQDDLAAAAHLGLGRVAPDARTARRHFEKAERLATATGDDATAAAAAAALE